VSATRDDGKFCLEAISTTSLSTDVAAPHPQANIRTLLIWSLVYET
jgi:hypothetical protein